MEHPGAVAGRRTCLPTRRTAPDRIDRRGGEAADRFVRKVTISVVARAAPRLSTLSLAGVVRSASAMALDIRGAPLRRVRLCQDVARPRAMAAYRRTLRPAGRALPVFSRTCAGPARHDGPPTGSRADRSAGSAGTRPGENLPGRAAGE